MLVAKLSRLLATIPLDDEGSVGRDSLHSNAKKEQRKLGLSVRVPLCRESDGHPRYQKVSQYPSRHHVCRLVLWADVDG